METGSIRVIGIVGACLLGVILLGKGGEIKSRRYEIKKSEVYLETTLPNVLALNDFKTFSSFFGNLGDSELYNRFKQSYGPCTVTSKPKCKPFTRSGGCPYTRNNMRCHVDLKCQKSGYNTMQIDLNRSGYGVNSISVMK